MGLTASAIAAVAAYFSIVGLAELFAAAMIPVIIMASVLETAKLVTTAWLHTFWNKTSWMIKLPLTAMVVALMLITSLGIFGFLSAGHLNQMIPADSARLEIQLIESKISQSEESFSRLQAQLDQLDSAIEVYYREGFATRGMQARKSQEPEREQIAKDMSDLEKSISADRSRLIAMKQNMSTIDAKLGPAKYLANLLGYEGSSEIAIYIVILLLMFAFDPLAVLLVIATTMTYHQIKRNKIPTAPIIENTDRNIEISDTVSLNESKIDENDILHFNEPELSTTVDIQDTKENIISNIDMDVDNLTNNDIIEMIQSNSEIMNDLQKAIDEDEEMAKEVKEFIEEADTNKFSSWSKPNKPKRKLELFLRPRILHLKKMPSDLDRNNDEIRTKD
ncbi:MAG: hypothetical protein WC284_08260 [Candidimonas sp.]